MLCFFIAPFHDVNYLQLRDPTHTIDVINSIRGEVDVCMNWSRGENSNNTIFQNLYQSCPILFFVPYVVSESYPSLRFDKVEITMTIL